MIVRKLGAVDASAFQALRLRALTLHPEAFGSSYEEEVSRSSDATARALEDGFVAGCESNGDLMGIAGLHRNGALKTKHRGVVWGMFVTPEGRRGGIGASLLTAVMEAARADLEEVTLSVAAHNAPAVALYRSFGFEDYGLDKRALKVAGTYVDELLMRRTL